MSTPAHSDPYAELTDLVRIELHSASLIKLWNEWVLAQIAADPYFPMGQWVYGAADKRIELWPASRRQELEAKIDELMARAT